MHVTFHGYSSICDGDGNTIEMLADKEGAVVADVHLGEGGALKPEVAASGYWSFGPGIFARPYAALMRALDALGQRAYRRNPRRAVAARARQSPSG